MAEKLYYGIDLGTTNSAIAYGYLGSNDNMITQICKVNRYGREGGLEAKEVLPSVVYYKYDAKNKDFKYFVGDFAKNQYGKKYGSVMKSVKNYMGYYDALPLDSKILDKKPEEVSAKILKHLVNGIKDRLSLEETPKDVIITIPASFDQDKCNATLEAAHLAGIKSKDENGNYLNEILLYEPKAVIYNIANMVSNGEIPKTTIDFSEPKNVLVFDLGGGTLDVALYKVSNNSKYNFPIIDELAVGRYTRIGGDDFDNLLADKLADEFMTYNNCTPDEVDFSEITQTMNSKAEYLKLELSNKVFDAKISGSKISDDEEFEISEMDLYKGMEFEAYLTKKEIENVFESLLGKHLTINDIDKIDKLVSEKDTNNIIYPILDVLAKAKETGKDFKVDSVILNGGMTKFYLIKNRIEEFFNLKAITVNDPDLAVAKGAVFYQYCLEKVGVINETIKAQNAVTINSETTPQKASLLTLGTSIVSENINLGLAKGYVSRLIKAGTILPMPSITLDKFSLPAMTDEIEFPIYIGRGNRTEFPNRKIASRIIKLSKKYPAGTNVTLTIGVDKNKVLNIEGYVGENKKETIKVSIETENTLKNDGKGIKVVSEEEKKVNPLVEFEALRASCETLDKCKKIKGKKLGPLEQQMKNNAKLKLSQTLEDIKICKNKGDFEKIILEKVKQLENNKILKGYLFELGAVIYPEMTEDGKEDFKKCCRSMVDLRYMNNGLNQENIIKAIIALGDIKDYDSAPLFENILESYVNKAYVMNIVRSLGLLTFDSTFLSVKFLEISENSLEISPYIYAVGKSFGREISVRNDKAVEKMAEKLLQIVKKEDANKDIALIALGCICDSSEEVKCKLNDNFIEKIGKELSLYIREILDGTFKEKANLILNVIYGLTLNDEEKATWNKLKRK